MFVKHIKNEESVAMLFQCLLDHTQQKLYFFLISLLINKFSKSVSYTSILDTLDFNISEEDRNFPKHCLALSPLHFNIQYLLKLAFPLRMIAKSTVFYFLLYLISLADEIQKSPESSMFQSLNRCLE